MAGTNEEAVDGMPTQNQARSGRPTYEDASRFLVQAGFGGGEREVDDVQKRGLEGWFLDQLRAPRASLVERHAEAIKHGSVSVRPMFWEGAMYGEDPLRQRVAYALSQIFVISSIEGKRFRDVFVHYLDMLAEGAFGTYADLLRTITYSPAMGLYLNHLGNQKANPRRGTEPDENFAREVMQLFTIGVVPLSDGGEPQSGETYGPDDVEGLAAIMTGLSWAGQDRFPGQRPDHDDPRRLQPMDAYPIAHEQRRKRFLGYEAEGPDPIKAIDGALAHLMAHPNTAPFVCRQLIQRLVTSNPSPDYVKRVGTAFKVGRFKLPSGEKVGSGAYSDLTATFAAILFDEDARGPARLKDPTFGRLREPTLRFAHILRAFAVRPWTPPAVPNPAVPSSRTAGQAAFGEQPWAAPSVFGFFHPNYQEAGSVIERAGLVSPEMQRMNAASAMGYLRLVTDAIKAPPERSGIDVAPLVEAAADTDVLVGVLSRTFFHDAMPSDLRGRMTKALSRVPPRPGDDRRNRQRTQLAVAMAATAPAFAVQR